MATGVHDIYDTYGGFRVFPEISGLYYLAELALILHMGDVVAAMWRCTKLSLLVLGIDSSTRE